MNGNTSKGNSSDRSNNRGRKTTSTEKTATKKVSSPGKDSSKKVQASAKDSREAGTKDGQLKAENSRNGEIREIFKRHRRRVRAIKQLCLGNSPKLQIQTRSFESNEEKERRKVEKQIRRAVMPVQLKRIRRGMFRILGGITTNKNREFLNENNWS